MLKYGTSTHKVHTVLLLESTAYIFGPLRNGMEAFFWPLLYIKLEVSTDRLKPKSAAFLSWLAERFDFSVFSDLSKCLP